MGLYDTLFSLNTNHNNMMITALDKEESGQKLLVSDGACVWSPDRDCSLTRNRDQIIKEAVPGIFEFNGRRYFADSLGSEKHIVICGGGHVSMPVISLGVMMDFKVTVIEDRPQFAENARRQGATNVICDDFMKALSRIEGNEDTYFVIVTRGHRYDKECLEAILPKKNAYIGMIGSRRRVGIVKENLREAGFSQDKLDAVYTPIGLKIGAETPEEIGIAIMGEIIQVKNSRKRSGGFPQPIRRAIQGLTEAEEGCVLATVIARKGSAPREVGTKMLVKKDGSIVGTIGGGCVEGDVITRGRRMLMLADKEPKIITVDLTGSGLAEEDGMVCGGILDVLLEWVE